MRMFNFSLAGTILLLAFISLQCKGKKDQSVSQPDFNPYISAFTSGTISSQSVIRIQFANEYTGEFTEREALKEKLFDFSPSIKGKTYWVDNRTIEFSPEKPLPQGKRINVKFYVSKLFDAAKEHAVFEFSFQTISQSLSVSSDGYQPYENEDLVWNRGSGKIITADYVDAKELQSVVSAKQEKKTLNIHWEADPSGRVYHFTIDSIQRQEKAATVVMEVEGKKIGFPANEQLVFNIPALSDFSLLDAKIIQQPEQYILIQFSDPLNRSQNLDGLIRLANNTSLRFTIEGNRVKAYPSVRQAGNISLIVEDGIKNILDFRLDKRNEITLSFEEVKPAVRLTGNGVILPNSDGLIFPFEAVNLSAVDISIVQIYENNVGYFLQVNSLEGDYQLKRAGRPVYKNTLRLDADPNLDLGIWNAFSLDLANLVNVQPGAIYRIEINFRRAYSLYQCPEDTDQQTLTEEVDREINYASWDSPDYYYYDDYEDYYYYDYDWNERDNPCHNSYYGSNRAVVRNVLASDLGIIAKMGSDQNLSVFISDLRNTQPLSGISFDILNYQMQVIGTGQTDKSGMAKIRMSNKPFLLIAKHGTQRGYLKLDDGSSLSLSRFDVGGQVVQKGLKGFIYGERGVWRPGDSLFLIFMLENKDKTLPENHPVHFELINPLGQVVRQMMRTASVNGLYNFSTSTAPDAPTGNWSARVKVGGTTFSKMLKIETIKPNRLKINLDFGKKMLVSEDKGVKGNLQVNWLHGAPAKSLRANISVNLTEASTSFTGYSDFVFSDPARSFTGEDVTVFDGKLNEQGFVTVESGISVSESSPGFLNASFTIRVFEESGDFSIDRFVIPYSPYKSYTGIKTPKGDQRNTLLTDADHQIEIVVLDAEGKPVTRNNLDVRVYKLQWKWWWDGSSENLASFIGNSYNKPVFQQKVNAQNGKGSFIFRINQPDWGRFFIRVVDPVSGHAAGKTIYIDWPGWAGRPQRGDAETATMLNFSTDKEKYTVGEMVNITLPTGENGRALVSLESGTKIIDAFWVESTGKETSFNFKVTPEMAPNVYANITLVQPHSKRNNDLPIRMYGVLPILVEDPGTRLEPQLDMPAVLAPEENVTLKVSEKSGKKMSYTIAIVDEGLLDLTRFPTPDPWSTFYAREALGIKTWDLYDFVMGAYGGRIEKLFSIGGDGDLIGKDPSQANRFKPMVRFMGPFTLEKGKTASHSILMPKYIGSVRTMVIAGYEGAYGRTEKTSPVKKPLMVLATLPRVLGPAETVKLPVTVFAMEESIRNVKVEVSTNENIKILGAKEKSISFTSVGDQVINFDLETTQKPSIGKVKVLVSSGREKAEYDIEIGIRNPNVKVVEFVDAIIDPGKEWNSGFMPPGIDGTNTGVLEISGIPPVDFGRRLKYLLDYPHGCVEQITSTAFPQLYLETMMELNETGKKMAESNVREAIRKLGTFQLPDGGLGYWPGAGNANDWGSSYAGHFMLEAEAKGYTLPAGFKDKWIRYQRSQSRNWNPPRGTQVNRYGFDDLTQAYRLYTLALAKSAEMGAMNRMKEQKSLSPAAKWRLAAAYALAGQTETARQLTLETTREMETYSGFNITYGSRERDMAMILEALTLMNEREKAIPVIKSISDALSSQEWMSTQTTAYCLLAVSKFVGSDGVSEGLNFDYTINNSKTTKASTKLPVVQVNMDLDKKEQGRLVVKNNGKGILFARIVMEGIPPVGEVTELENNLRLTIAYKDMSGNSLDISSIEQGTDFIAEVRIANPGVLGNYSDMALTQIFPSGWEIQNLRMTDFGAAIKSDVFNYQDVRDDRVHTYFDLRANESKKFVVILNAAYLGKFYLPGPYCEAMYDKRVNSRKAGHWVEVVKPGE
jgi:alpha-2-macroglobulin